MSRKTSPTKGRGKRKKGKAKNTSFPLFLLPLTFFLFPAFSGCGPKYSYPADTVPRAVETICMEEYGYKVNSRVVGKTLGVVFSTNLDKEPNSDGQRDLQERLSKIIQAATRVALSTDMELDYCTAALRDPSKNLEMTLTRSVDDVKRANADAIGIEEAMNRTLFSQGHALAGGQDLFWVEEVRKDKFLADQIVQRIRLSYAKDMEEETATQPLILVDGNAIDSGDRRTFRFSILALRAENTRDALSKVFQIVNATLQAYRYLEFDELEVQDYLNRQKLVVDRQTLLDYQEKRLTEAELFERCLVESTSIQDAFKLFGFSMPQETPVAVAPSP